MVSKKLFSLVSLLVLMTFTLRAQVENVIVERYYVSDASDATDTIGGGLAAGSVTYRIYIDLNSGSRLKRIYGDAGHPIVVESTQPFFNNLSDGQTFAYNFNRTRYEENTVALDSWLTLGQVTRNSTKTYFGVLKPDDSDGSFVGGVNNDGGSALVPGGLLVNNDSSAGIPLTIADGIDTMLVAANSFFSDGIVDPLTGDDSTIFGSLQSGSSFYSTSAFLANSIGAIGKSSATNQVLVAQLTTAGELRFKLNLIVEEPSTPFPKEVKYVAEFAPGETNTDTLKLFPLLNYPPVCGCTDPQYIEYSPSYSCGNSDSCRTLVVFGCMDTSACNYDPSANYNLPTMCCYPGYCNDRDLTVVCPQLNLGRREANTIKLFPIPVKEHLSVEFKYWVMEDIGIEIYSAHGQFVGKFDFPVTQPLDRIQLNTLDLRSGIYFVHIGYGDFSTKKMIIKE